MMATTAANMSKPIDYQSRQIATPPSEYEHAYDQERGRWLRRRLLWYSGTSLAFGLLLSLPAVLIKGDGVSQSDVLTLVFSNAAAACVMILAWRCKPKAQLVLRIAFLFYVLASLWSIGYTYSTISQQASELQNGFDRGFEAGKTTTDIQLGGPTTRPATQSTTAPTTASSATATTATRPSLIEGDLNRYDEPVKINFNGGSFFSSASKVRDNFVHGIIYIGLLFGFAFNHIFACLFIPWTVRESLRPAGIIAGATLGMTAINVLLGQAHWWMLVAMFTLLPFAFIPGTLVCWWRFSRFNRNFQMQFESGRYRALQHELNSAREVHDANLPEARLTGPVRLNYLYEPMRQIGGDLLMIYPPDKDAIPRYVILFDVTGHGVTAALSVNRIVGEIERLLAENPDESAENLARALNRYVHLTLAKHHLYVSALLMRIDVDANKIDCVNSGHPTAYHINCLTRTTEPLESTSMLLGVVGADDFLVETLSIPFNKGDAIVGYTDGASEATDPDGKMLGMRGVREAIELTIANSTNPCDWPIFVSRLVIEHRLAPSQDDTIIFSLWRE